MVVSISCHKRGVPPDILRKSLQFRDSECFSVFRQRLITLFACSWNVYGRENRLKVARDEAKHEEQQRTKLEKQRLVRAMLEASFMVLSEHSHSINLRNTHLLTILQSRGRARLAELCCYSKQL